jgi:hypothetical protein
VAVVRGIRDAWSRGDVKFWRHNQNQINATPATVVVTAEWYRLAANCIALLDAMLAHPVHAPEVERIVEDINPMAKFPAREARQARMTKH